LRAALCLRFQSGSKLKDTPTVFAAPNSYSAKFGKIISVGKNFFLQLDVFREPTSLV
jgi:hypothetical protein